MHGNQEASDQRRSKQVYKPDQTFDGRFWFLIVFNTPSYGQVSWHQNVWGSVPCPRKTKHPINNFLCCLVVSSGLPSCSANPGLNSQQTTAQWAAVTQGPLSQWKPKPKQFTYVIEWKAIVLGAARCKQHQCARVCVCLCVYCRPGCQCIILIYYNLDLFL